MQHIRWMPFFIAIFSIAELLSYELLSHQLLSREYVSSFNGTTNEKTFKGVFHLNA